MARPRSPGPGGIARTILVSTRAFAQGLTARLNQFPTGTNHPAGFAPDSTGFVRAARDADQVARTHAAAAQASVSSDRSASGEGGSSQSGGGSGSRGRGGGDAMRMVPCAATRYWYPAGELQWKTPGSGWVRPDLSQLRLGSCLWIVLVLVRAFWVCRVGH